ncbi:MAG TPA: nucleotidyltransferase domain-containing protein [Candidatus Nanoarchaeia archaeon]|nr:nucleotidyltransferase domain-containing protein [Candidatus Nanoarchaeia archaeon]
MVNMYKQELTILQQEILRLLFVQSGFSLNQRGIARMLDVSQPAVMKSLPGLKKKNLIKINQDKESRRWAVEFNRDNLLALQLKRTDNLRQVYESGLATFLREEFPGATIILFGSYSRGDDTIYSDIDIAIIGRKEKSVKLTEFHKKLERNISINFYPSLKEVHKHLKDNILNGIVLHGSVEL